MTYTSVHTSILERTQPSEADTGVLPMPSSLIFDVSALRGIADTQTCTSYAEDSDTAETIRRLCCGLQGIQNNVDKIIEDGCYAGGSRSMVDGKAWLSEDILRGLRVSAATAFLAAESLHDEPGLPLSCLVLPLHGLDLWMLAVGRPGYQPRFTVDPSVVTSKEARCWLGCAIGGVRDRMKEIKASTSLGETVSDSRERYMAPGWLEEHSGPLLLKSRHCGGYEPTSGCKYGRLGD